MGKVTRVINNIEKLPTVDQNKIADFTRRMTEKVIPEIVEDLKSRQVLAAKIRHRRIGG